MTGVVLRSLGFIPGRQRHYARSCNRAGGVSLVLGDLDRKLGSAPVIARDDVRIDTYGALGSDKSFGVISLVCFQCWASGRDSRSPFAPLQQDNVCVEPLPVARLIEPFERYLCERVAAYPELSGKRLLREVRELGYGGCCSILTGFLRECMCCGALSSSAIS